MAEFEFRVSSIVGAGYDASQGDVVIASDLGESGEMLWSFPADDTPELMLLLSESYSRHIALSGHVKGQTLAVDTAQFLEPKAGESILFLGNLATGTSVSLSIPISVARALHAQLSEIFGK